MDDVVLSLIVGSSLPLMIYVARGYWRDGERALSVACLMAGWGLGGRFLLVELYCLLASQLELPAILAGLLLPLVIALAIVGLVGTLWLSVLHIGRWKRDEEAFERWHRDEWRDR
jgi:hypothetical protein